jgi:hypothetical protein
VNAATPGLHLLDTADREYLVRLVQADGLSATARQLGVGRGIVAAAVGGIQVRRGSIEMLRNAIRTRRRANGKK